MRKPAKLLAIASAASMLLGSLAIAPAAIAGDAENGKKVAEDRKKGNCFACHNYQGAHLAGNIGPSLDGIGKRMTEQQIADQINDPTKRNPNTSMPPFGKYQILSKDEVADIAAWAAKL